MSIRISIDVGGTFTDLVVCDEQGRLKVYKSPTTPGKFHEGVMNAIDVAAEARGETVSNLLEKCSTFVGGSLVHGSTISTNAVLTGKVAKTGFITTRGFKDILTLRSGFEKHNPYNWREEFQPPYIPRYLTMEVTERVSAEGEIVVPLNEDDVRKAVEQLKEYNVEAIAVCLLWDIMNSTHANRIGEIIEEEWPEVSYVLAVDLNPCLREVWRASSACIDASLTPVMHTYFTELVKGLEERGYRGNLSMLTSTGGIITVDEALAKPIYSIDCGPAMAPVAGRAFAALEGKKSDILVIDMGGTSFDVSSVIGGKFATTREAKISGEYDLGIAKVDSRSVGAGGGSIAWIDPGGMVHVGPDSAAADPGPACYGKGGEEPTVTDANLILGYLDPDYYLGGKMNLYPQLAEKAIMDKIGKPLNLSLQEAAYTIFSTINVNMVTAIEQLTIWQGIDPREFLFASGGAAAGLHVIPICKQLGAKEAIMPSTAGGLSAVGGMFGDLIGEYSSGLFLESYRWDEKAVNSRLEMLEKKGIEFLERCNVPKEKRELEFFVEARYPYQIWELPVRLRNRRIIGDKQVEELVNDFHDEHERVFSVKEDTFIECTNWRVRAIGKVDPPVIEEIGIEGNESGASHGSRRIFIDPDIGEVEATVYHGDELKPGNIISPTSIIYEDTTTLVVFPGSKVTVSRFGNYLIQMD